jgi:hypothetical protein
MHFDFKKPKNYLLMKQFSLLIGLLLIGLTTSNAMISAGEPMDTIIKVEGKVMPVDVIKVTPTYVRFSIPDNDEVFTIPRKEIHKILYKNGRVEEYNAMVVMMIDEYSWEAVWLTEDPEDVVSLYKRGEVKSQSSASARSPKAAKKNATIRLQKKAAAMQGIVVLVEKRQATGGYGEFPGYYIEGIVYGTEPMEEEVSGDVL